MISTLEGEHETLPEDQDEVLRLKDKICERLEERGLIDDLTSVQNYFYSEIRCFSQGLAKHLKKEQWSVLFEGVCGERRLNVAVAGKCPGACLMGLFVWLCESQHYECQASCTVMDQSLSQSMLEVHSAIEEHGWNLTLQSLKVRRHTTENAKRQFDMVLIGHPNPEADFWPSVLSEMLPGGCIVIVDHASSSSFVSLDSIPQLQRVNDETGSDSSLVAEKTARSNQYRNPYVHDTDSENGQRDADSAATVLAVYTSGEKRGTRDQLAKNMGVAVGPMETGSLLQRHASSKAPPSDREWRGRWIDGVPNGAVPPRLLFPSLGDKTMSENKEFFEYCSYHTSQNVHSNKHRIELEGMGRPLLMLSYKSCRPHCSST